MMKGFNVTIPQQAILGYLMESDDLVGEDDFTVNEIEDFLESDAGVEEIVTEILDYVMENNSRYSYNHDNIYEVARIVRKRRI